jgi:poly(A) polymerase
MPRANKLPSLARAKWLKEPRLQQVLAAIAAAGGEARVAGGAVRNALMGEKVTEVDLACSLPPDAMIAAFKSKGMAVHLTGIDHGTVTVVQHGAVFEITTLRHDVETDGRRAVVQYTDDWAGDAHRRDFTMNALYADAGGKIYDFTDGYADIVQRRVRFVGSPSARIKEDYLRILRFFRFHARYGKGGPDAAGLKACKQLKSGLKGLSAERLRQEMLKLLAAPGAVPTLKVMAKNGILQQILPHTEDWRVIGRLPPDGVMRLFALAKVPLGLKDRLRLSNAEAARIEALHVASELSPKLTAKEQRRLLYEFGAQAWSDAAHLSCARSRAKEGDGAWRRLIALPTKWTPPAFPVKGRDLLKVGFVSGPELGAMLQELEDWWIASDFKPGKDELLERAKMQRGQ